MKKLSDLKNELKIAQNFRIKAEDKIMNLNYLKDQERYSNCLDDIKFYKNKETKLKKQIYEL
jgi:hypothetical protein